MPSPGRRTSKTSIKFNKNLTFTLGLRVYHLPLPYGVPNSETNWARVTSGTYTTTRPTCRQRADRERVQRRHQPQVPRHLQQRPALQQRPVGRLAGKLLQKPHLVLRARCRLRPGCLRQWQDQPARRLSASATRASLPTRIALSIALPILPSSATRTFPTWYSLQPRPGTLREAGRLREYGERHIGYRWRTTNIQASPVTSYSLGFAA